MTTRVSNKTLTFTTESDQRKSGRRLALTFSAGLDPALEKIEFWFDADCEPVCLERDGPDLSRSFKWGKSAKAFALVFLDYVCWENDDRLFVFPTVDTEQVARTFGNNHNKSSGITKRVFIEKRLDKEIEKRTGERLRSQRPHANQIIRIVNIPGTNKPKAVKITRDLPSDCVEVYCARRGKLTIRDDILSLANLIREVEKSPIADRAVPKNDLGPPHSPNVSAAPNPVVLQTDMATALPTSRNSALPAYIDDLIAEKTRNFVGRKYIFDAINASTARRSSGYIHIRGEPGQGKTAILAELVRTRGLPAHFNSRAEGRTSEDLFLKSIYRQLAARYKFPEEMVSVDELISTSEFSQVLHGVAAALAPDEQLLIAVDALDEIHSLDRNSGRNILFLPSNLPDRIFIVLSSRAGAIIPLRASSIESINLSDFAKESLEDIEQYVEQATHQAAVKRWIRLKKISTKSFVEIVTKKSQCNFMYVYYVLHDVAGGQFNHTSLFDLPTGLESYYQMHWERMGMMRQPVSRERLRLLFTLSQLRMPVSRKLLAEFSKLDPILVQEIIDEWLPFLKRQTIDGEAKWSIYHDSFSEFIQRADIVQAAGVSLSSIHSAIAEKLLRELHG